MELVFIGQISLFVGNFAPKDWIICDGRLMDIARNPALFSIMETKYGGDGRTTFALPKMQPYGDTNFFIAVKGAYPQRPS